MALLASLLLATAAAQTPLPEVLGPASFRPGLWESNPVGRLDRKQRACIIDPARVVISGSTDGCTRRVLNQAGDAATLTWTCPDGNGRTDVRRSDTDSFTLVLQGVRGKLPFNDRIEMRRVGDCPGDRR